MKKNVELNVIEALELKFMINTKVKELKDEIESDKAYLKLMLNGNIKTDDSKIELCRKVIADEENKILLLQGLLKKLED